MEKEPEKKRKGKALLHSLEGPPHLLAKQAMCHGKWI